MRTIYRNMNAPETPQNCMVVVFQVIHESEQSPIVKDGQVWQQVEDFQGLNVVPLYRMAGIDFYGFQ